MEKEQEKEWLELEKFSVHSCPNGAFPVYHGVSIIDCVFRKGNKAKPF
ncbi:hypothetical protein [Bartonella massiliensis]|nr:hypothetical protein [Bartonella massiliensis]